jgi:hypothetical protein
MAIFRWMSFPNFGGTCHKIQTFKIIQLEWPEFQGAAEKHRLGIEARVHLLSLAI